MILLHLLRTDLRQFRWLIGACILTVAASTTADGLWPMFAGHPARMQQLGFAGTLLWLASLLVMAVAIPLVMHAHPFVGSDAFWMTRPIPPMTLLVSKAALLVGLAVGVPVAFEYALMAGNHMPMGAMARVAAETSLWRLLLLGALMGASAMTSSLARVAALCVGVLISGVVLISATIMVLMSREQGESGGFLLSGSYAGEPFMNADATTSFVAAVLLVIVASLVLVVQARTRLRRWSVAVVIVGVVAAVPTSAQWPWRVLRVAVTAPAWAANDSALQLRGDPHTVLVIDRTAKWEMLQARIALAGIDPGWLALVAIRNATLDLPGSVRLSSPFAGGAQFIPIEADARSQQRRVLGGILGVERLVFDDVPIEALSMTPLFAIRQADLGRYAPATGRYRGQAVVSLSRREIASTLSLQRGATYQDGAYRFVLDQIVVDRGAVSLGARVARATSIFDGRPTPSYTYFLRNRSRSEVVGSYEVTLRGPLLLSQPFLYGFSVSSGFSAGASSIRFPDWSHRATEPVTVTDAWLKEAELVIVRETAGGSVERTLEIDDFPLHVAEPSR